MLSRTSRSRVQPLRGGSHARIEGCAQVSSLRARKFLRAKQIARWQASRRNAQARAGFSCYPNNGAAIMSRTLTCLYDDYDVALETARDLEAGGVPTGDISLIANNAENRYAPAA